MTAAKDRRIRRQEEFLAVLRESGGNISEASRRMRISSGAVAGWRRNDPEYDAAVRHALIGNAVSRTVAANPGLTEKDVQRVAGLSHMATYTQLRRLMRTGEIVRVKDAGETARPQWRYYTADAPTRTPAPAPEPEPKVERKRGNDPETRALDIIRDIPGLTCDEIGISAGNKDGNEYYKPLRYLVERGDVLRIKRPTSKHGRAFCYYPNTPDGRRLAEEELNVPVRTGERKFYDSVRPAAHKHVEIRAKIAAAIRLAGKIDAEKIADRIDVDADAIRAELRKMTDAGQVDFETVTFRRTDGLLGIRRFYYLA